MKKTFFVLFLLGSLFSCKTKKDLIIPEKKMIPLLVDLFIADGIDVYSSEIRKKVELDSTKLYGWVFKKHNCSRIEFDSTLSFYVKNPDKFNEMMDQVIEELNKQEMVLEEKINEEKKSHKILWKDKKKYTLPDDGKTSMIPFSIKINKQGTYIVSASIRLYRNDESANPQIMAYFWRENSGKNDTIKYFTSILLKKNNRFTEYSVIEKMGENEYTYLKGYILFHTNLDSLFVKHAIVKDISISYFKN